MTLTIKNASKTFSDGTRALKPVSLDIDSGEVLALLGPSGCGKTTLLRIIAGLETPNPATEIYFDQTEVTNTSVERRNVGMVFQSYALFPNMSVRENVGYGLKVRSVPRAERDKRVEDMLRLCRLTDYADRNIKALSGGQRQRVALARAVAPSPKVLLLDEPLSALDAALRDQLRDELGKLLRELAITAVFVTHDQAEAMAIADRIAVMRDGELLQLGDPAELYHQPSDPFVATFVGNAVQLSGETSSGELLLNGGRQKLPYHATVGEVYVRPESVKVSQNGPLTGKIEQVIFAGGFYRLVLSGILGSEQLLHANLFGKEPPKVGQEVGVTIDPNDLIIFPTSF